MTLQPLNYCKGSQQLPFAKMTGSSQAALQPFIYHSKHNSFGKVKVGWNFYIFCTKTSIVLCIRTSDLPTCRHASDIDTELHPDKHQLAQVSLYYITNALYLLNWSQTWLANGQLSPWNASWGRLTGNSNTSSGCNLFVQLVFSCPEQLNRLPCH